MVQSSVGLSLPDSYFTNAKIENAEKMKAVNQPLMWMHGTADSFLAIDTHGEVVYKNYSGVRGEAHRIAGAEHDGEKGVPKVMGFANYLAAIEEFLTTPN
jgi:hypothetical protein